MTTSPIEIVAIPDRTLLSTHLLCCKKCKKFDYLNNEIKCYDCAFPALSSKQRNKIIVKLKARDGKYCRKCNVELYFGHWYSKCPDNKRRATIEHIIPQIKGGKHNIENLTLYCLQCNVGHGICVGNLNYRTFVNV